MCGIAGGFGRALYSYDNIAAASVLLRHRGPDDEGVALINYGEEVRSFKGSDSRHRKLHSFNATSLSKRPDGVMLHRRLSILDLSEAGHQPMISNCGSYVLTLNGEIYNFVELRSGLRSRSVSFSTKTDTEVLLQAFIEWETEAFAKCIGMWSVALYDEKKATLTLCRDRFGIKPLYYLQKPGVLWYSSEIQALLRISGEHAFMDPVACKEYILFGDLSSRDGTLFGGVRQLLPGTMLQYDFRDDKATITEYYNLDEVVSTQRSSDSDGHDSPIDVIGESLRIHLRSDVPVGVCLSGGLDSTTLIHLAAQHLPSNAAIPSFSAVYPGSPFSEEAPIREFLQTHRNVHPTFVTPTIQGMLVDFDSLIKHQELPFNSTSIYAQWEVMKAVSAAGIKVVVDGQGADEIACGYYSYGGVFVLELLRAYRIFAFLKHTLLLMKKTSPSIAKHLAVAIASHVGMRTIGGKSLGKTTDRYLNNEGMSLATPGPPERWGSDIVDHSLKTMRYGLQQLLRYEDRNSMAFSVEARVPYLDHRVVEYFLKMPSGRKISDGYLKHVIRTAMSPFLPASVAWKKGKLGFVTPQHEWRKALSNEDMKRAADGLVGTGLVNVGVLVERSKAKQLSAAEESEFWRMYTLGRWHETMIGGAA